MTKPTYRFLPLCSCELTWKVALMKSSAMPTWMSVVLLRSIRKAQSAMAAMFSPQVWEAPH